MKHTLGKIPQPYDPLKPSTHLDKNNIIYENQCAVENAVKIVNDVQQKILKLNQSHNSAPLRKKMFIQQEINRLTAKYDDYQDHLNFCVESLNHARNI